MRPGLPLDERVLTLIRASLATWGVDASVTTEPQEWSATGTSQDRGQGAAPGQARERNRHLVGSNANCGLFPSPSWGGGRGGGTIQSDTEADVPAGSPHTRPLPVKGRGEEAGATLPDAATAICTIRIEGGDIHITRAPPELPFRWLVRMATGRERPASSVTGLLRVLRSTLDPSWRPGRARVVAVPPV